MQVIAGLLRAAHAEQITPPSNWNDTVYPSVVDFLFGSRLEMFWKPAALTLLLLSLYASYMVTQSSPPLQILSKSMDGAFVVDSCFSELCVPELFVIPVSARLGKPEEWRLRRDSRTRAFSVVISLSFFSQR
eukprot:XP_001705544.1 Hypothetical protein GL50803_20153 [Giardia lamblia ATCC 50803]